MSKSMMMLLMICLSVINCSCIEKKMVCAQVKANTIDPLLIHDLVIEKNEYDEYVGRCRVSCYNFNKQEGLPWTDCGVEREGSAAVNYPIEYCNGIIGFHYEAYGIDLKPKVNKLDTLHNNLCD